MENIVETVRFKLKEGADVNTFVEAAKGTISLIKGCEGYLYRSLSLNEQTQEWTDIVYWATLADAKAASDNFMKDESAQKMVSYIDRSSLVMAHEQIMMSPCTIETA